MHVSVLNARVCLLRIDRVVEHGPQRRVHLKRICVCAMCVCVCGCAQVGIRTAVTGWLAGSAQSVGTAGIDAARCGGHAVARYRTS